MGPGNFKTVLRSDSTAQLLNPHYDVNFQVVQVI